MILDQVTEFTEVQFTYLLSFRGDGMIYMKHPLQIIYGAVQASDIGSGQPKTDSIIQLLLTMPRKRRSSPSMGVQYKTIGSVEGWWEPLHSPRFQVRRDLTIGHLIYRWKQKLVWPPFTGAHGIEARVVIYEPVLHISEPVIELPHYPQLIRNQYVTLEPGYLIAEDWDGSLEHYQRLDAIR